MQGKERRSRIRSRSRSRPEQANETIIGGTDGGDTKLDGDGTERRGPSLQGSQACPTPGEQDWRGCLVYGPASSSRW